MRWEGVVLEGRYRITRSLGKGGMGEVYLAEDARTSGRKAAIKVPLPHVLAQEGFRERFAREIRSLLGFEHAHVVRVYNVGEHQGTPYLVLQYLSGGSLEQRLSKGKQSPREVLEWLPKVASALDALHAGGLVHRDIKPGNILLDEHGDPFVSDFGIVKVLGELSLTPMDADLGSPQYMAPESGTKGGYTGAYDQYSLATVAYQALSGQLPFGSFDRFRDYLAAVMTQPPRPLAEVAPNVPARACAAVMKALSKEPGERFGSCQAFAKAFEAGLTVRKPPGRPDDTVKTPPGGKQAGTKPEQEPNGEDRRPPPRPVWIGVVAVMALAGLLAYWVWPSGKPLPEQLAACRVHLEAGRLSEGAGGNALECYQGVLQRSPGNAEALKGLEAIAERSFSAAEQALASGEYDQAEHDLERAAQVSPEHPRLAALTRKLREARVAKAPPPAAERPISRAAAARTGTGTTVAVPSEPLDFEPEMVRVSRGCFQMGSPRTEADRDKDERQHRVCVEDFENREIRGHPVPVGCGDGEQPLDVRRLRRLPRGERLMERCHALHRQAQ